MIDCAARTIDSSFMPTSIKCATIVRRAMNFEYDTNIKLLKFYLVILSSLADRSLCRLARLFCVI